jgi:hypothetical protein
MLVKDRWFCRFFHYAIGNEEFFTSLHDAPQTASVGALMDEVMEDALLYVKSQPFYRPDGSSIEVRFNDWTMSALQAFLWYYEKWVWNDKGVSFSEAIKERQRRYVEAGILKQQGERLVPAENIEDVLPSWQKKEKETHLEEPFKNARLLYEKEFETELNTIPHEMRNGFLVAPNGNRSNLPNPRAWKIVRTEAFKRWFGDWIKDPKNASK